MRLGVSRFEALAPLSISGLGGTEYAMFRRALPQPSCFLLQRRRLLDVFPGDMIGCCERCCINRSLVVADDGEEIAVTYEFHRRLGGGLDRLFVDGFDGGATIGLAHHPRMHHAVERHVVDEGALAENL